MKFVTIIFEFLYKEGNSNKNATNARIIDFYITVDILYSWT